MIVTLTINPTIDKSTEVKQLLPEKKLRCKEMLIEAGGGGINISKAIQELGGKCFAIFPYGGINGRLLLQLMAQKGIPTQAMEISGETRESIVINEASTNKQYRFILPGPMILQEETQKIKSLVGELTSGDFLICSGSLPPGISPEFLGEIACVAKEKGIRFVVDTSGEPLRAAIKQGVYLIKPNMSELCSLVNKEYLELSEIDAAVEQVLANNSCEILVVSMGPSGAMLATKTQRKRFTAPVVKKRTTVGAGDSMIAGIVYMLEQNNSIDDAVRFGIACGTAATISNGSQLFRREDALKFYEWMKANGSHSI